MQLARNDLKICKMSTYKKGMACRFCSPLHEHNLNLDFCQRAMVRVPGTTGYPMVGANLLCHAVTLCNTGPDDRTD